MKTRSFLLCVWLVASSSWIGTAQAASPDTALSFDGADDYVVASFNQELNVFPLAVQAWVRSTDLGLDRGIVCKYQAGSFNGYQVYLSEGKLYAWYFRDRDNAVWGGDRGLEGGFIADGLWHHITFVVDADGGRLQVDGQLRSTKPWTGSPGVVNTTQPLELGRYRGRYFHGEIDDLAIWSTPPSTDQILALINRPSYHGLSGLLAYVSADEGEGAKAGASAGTEGGFFFRLFNGVSWSLVGQHRAAQRVTEVQDGLPGSLRNVISNALPYDTVQFVTTGIHELTQGEIVLSKDLTIVGLGGNQSAISGKGESRLFSIPLGVTISLSDLSLRDGYPGLVDQNSNTGRPGGAILNRGRLSLSHCWLSDNHTGPFSMSTRIGSGGNGGAIANMGVLKLSNCTLWSNSAGSGFSDQGSGWSAGSGGAIWSDGELTLEGCTLTDNQAGMGVGMLVEAGGGGAIASFGSLRLTSCTIVGNRAGRSVAPPPFDRPGRGGGILHAQGDPGYLRNSLIGGNTVSGGTDLGPDLVGNFMSGGHNVVGEIEGAGIVVNGINEDQLGGLTAKIQATLLPLGQYGGSVPTISLTPSSPAFDAGDNTLTGKDARGLPRRAGRQVDVGAFELELDQYALPDVPRAAELGEIRIPVTARFIPGLLPIWLHVNYGSGTNLSLSTLAERVEPGTSEVAITLWLTAPDLSTVLNYRFVATSSVGTSHGPILRLGRSCEETICPGGVDPVDLKSFLRKYFVIRPPAMDRFDAGVGPGGGGAVRRFRLANLEEMTFSVLASTNASAPRAEWQAVGEASLQYEFADPDGVGQPMRFYQLEWR
ncbi:MAG: LamG domain-containing protein [Verrucomicrobiales bacterium]|nr:LamG domain-containing protein [Verrucomicrobiales bacterium]